MIFHLLVHPSPPKRVTMIRAEVKKLRTKSLFQCPTWEQGPKDLCHPLLFSQAH